MPRRLLEFRPARSLAERRGPFALRARRHWRTLHQAIAAARPGLLRWLLGLFGLVVSRTPETLLRQHRILAPGRFARAVRGPLCARLGFGLAPPDQLPELFDFVRLQVPPHARRQPAEGQKSDLYAPQLFHQAMEMLEHDTNLVLAAFHQPDFVPRVVGLLDELDLGRRRAASAQRDARPERFHLLVAEEAVRLDDVDLFHVTGRRRNAVGKLAVGGQQ